MLHLVVADTYCRDDAESARDVSAQAHAAGVGLAGDDRDEVGMHEVVELDLLVAERVVARDPGPVRGFAVVLSLGIVTSMFTALIVSRALVYLLWDRKRKLDRLSIGMGN